MTQNNGTIMRKQSTRLMGWTVSGLVRLFQGYSIMNSSRIKLLPLFLLAALACLVPPAGAQTAFVNFNAVADYTNNFYRFTNGNVGQNFTETNSGGIGGTRAVLIFAANDFTATYKTRSWDFSTNGASITISTLLKANALTNANKLQFGILNVTTNGLNNNAGVAFASFRTQPEANATLTNWSMRTQTKTTTNGATAETTFSPFFTIVPGRWYKYVITFTNTSGTGTYSNYCRFIDYGTDGLTPGTNMFSFNAAANVTGAHLASSTAGSNVYPAMRFLNNAGADLIDNFLVYTPSSLPILTLGLSNVVALAGNAVVLKTLADGPGTISYQWYSNGVALADVTTSNFTTAPLIVSGSYQLVASNINGTVTNTANITVNAAPPTSLAAVGGTNQASLTWAAAATATNYVIQRSTTSGGPYTRITTNSGTSYTDTGLSAGTTYYYVTLAQAPAGESTNSTQASALTVPNAPTTLSALAGDTKVTLSWTASTGASSYVLKRSLTSGSGYTSIVTNGVLSFVDTNVVNLTTYYYVVSARNATGDSATTSPEASAQPNVAPTNLVAVGSAGQIALKWNALGGATSYTVKRAATSGGIYSVLASGVTDTNYVDTPLAGGSVLFYVVSAQIPGGESANSLEVGGSTPLDAPVGLTATPASISEIDLAWASGGSGATGYKIERSGDGSSYAQIGTASGTTYPDLSSSPSTIYYYRVRSYNAFTNSPYSSVIMTTNFSVVVAVNFGSGPLGTGGSMTNYPGYLPDIGEVYGLRTNGFSYGWDADNQANGRWRLSGTSPDFRYDTLNHLQKQVPSRVWEIGVSNGLYGVRVVGGDATAIDMLLQFTVEGTTTAALSMTNQSQVAAHWIGFTNNVTVSDGRLTITSGASAINNKICFMEAYGPSAGASILAQPSDTNTVENTTLTLAVSAYGAPPPAYQWYFNTNTLLAGKTGPYLGFSPVLPANAGMYSVVVSNVFGVVTSRYAVVTVAADLVAPTILGATADATLTNITLTFSEPVDHLTAISPGNYALSGGLTMYGLTHSPGSSNVLITTTAPMTQGVVYSVTNNGIKDVSVAGNTIAPNSVVSFTAWLLQTGYLRADVFTNIANGTVADLTNNVKYTGNRPDFTNYLMEFWFYGQNPDLTELANYGVRVSGYFTPPSNGVFRFFLRSDDSSQLWMNTNGMDPAGKVLIAQETGCCHSYNPLVTSGASNVNAMSTNITLVAGQRYYMEALMKQGGGGQYLQAAFREAGATSVPSSLTNSSANGAPALPNTVPFTIGTGTNEVAAGQFFSVWINPDLTPLTFGQQPQSTNIFGGQTAQFSVLASVMPGTPSNYPVSLLSYQWKSNGVTIAGATAATYTTPALAATADGALYTCVVTAPGHVTTSSAATVRVLAVPTGLTAVGGTNQISVSWTASPSATNYVLSRSVNSTNSFTLLLTTNGTFAVDAGLADGVTNYYVVAAQGPSGQTANSAPASAVTAPPAPTGVGVSSGDGKVTLGWLAVPAATSYIVMYSTTPGGPYTPLSTNSATSFIHDGLANGMTTNHYVIQAVNAGGFSPLSSEVIGQPNLPPVGLVATGGTSQISLVWNELAGATTYNVKRSATGSGGPFTVLASGLADTNYTDATTAPGLLYYYVVSAQLVGGVESGDSAPAGVFTAPGAPTSLTATFAGTAQINLAWASANTPSVTTILIERSSDGSSFGQIASVSGTLTAYSDNNLASAVTYYYRVRATNAIGVSPYSSVASASVAGFTVKVNFVNATNGQPANVTPPYVLGYVLDLGEVYGLRTNGFTYGWDVDNMANSRYRQHGATYTMFPGGVYDARLDTFNHMLKPLPAGRIWELGLPKGVYQVVLAGGDPDNLNTTQQFDIEGNVTLAHNCTTENVHWVGFTNTVVVTDGRLSISNGPSADNTKVCYVDISPIRPDLAIGTQPQSQEVLENRPVVFSVTLTNGAAPITYQWFHDGSPIADATNAAFHIALAQMADAGGYWVGISNFVGSITSAVATLIVDTDSAPPVIVSVGSLNGSEVGIVFDEIIDPVRDGVATDPTYYTVNGYYPQSVAVRSDGRTVQLKMAEGEEVSGSFEVAVYSLYDLKGNQMDIATGTGTVLSPAASYQDVGTGVGTIDPLYLGSTFVGGPDYIEVLAGGTDIWSTNDQMHFVHQSVTGDFQVQVRVDSLRRSDPWTKAGLLARPSLAANSPNLGVFVTPTVAEGGAGVYQTQARPTSNANSVVLTQAALLPSSVQWLQLQRTNGTFYTAYSTDGVTWTPFATNTPSPALPMTLEVGLATTAHNNDTNFFTLARYAEFSLSSAPSAKGSVALEAYVGPQQTGNGSRDVTFTATDVGGSPLATWTQSLNFAGGVAPYTLANVPAATANLSAKTAWNLRKRLSVRFAANVATAANFTGNSTLPVGDLDNSNLVDLADYFQLATAWYQPNAAADLDGSGFVDLDDYFLLASHWGDQGDDL